MGEMVLKYWVQELFALVIALISYQFKRLTKWKKDQDVVRVGIIAILHDRLYQACTFFIRQGFCSVEDKKNLEYLYAPYKELGGNGTGTALYEQCMKLPIELAGKAE